MSANGLPFLTSYDPPGSSEGTLDPLGLYQLADQLAVQLVPAVRERMQRIRFVTALTIGTYAIDEIEDDPKKRDASPYLVWEWLVVEALARESGDDPSIRGVPGMLMAKRALRQHGYLDARSYLKNPEIFGFFGVYKRLAVQIGLIDINLAPGPKSEALRSAWGHDMGFSSESDFRRKLALWSDAVNNSLKEDPPRTMANWPKGTWAELAAMFNPSTIKAREKRFLKDLLINETHDRLGALPAIWQLQAEFEDDKYSETLLHERLRKKHPAYSPLIEAIQAYEAFCRRLQDAFDILLAEAGKFDAKGFSVPDIAKDQDFFRCIKDIHSHFERTYQALGELENTGGSLRGLFEDRFGAFSEPMGGRECAIALCSLHEDVQKRKSAEGKRPWFDRIGPNRIFIRHSYRIPRHDVQTDKYVHGYRGIPIRRFYKDLI